MKIGDTVYVIGMKQPSGEHRQMYSAIKKGKIYKGVIRNMGTSFDPDISVRASDGRGWALKYPLQELSNVELLVALHKAGIKIEDVPTLP